MLLMGKINAGSTHIAAKANYRFSLIIKVDSCKPGMVLAENLFNNHGAIVLRENTPMNPQMIEKLKKIGIGKIKVYARSININLSDSLRHFEENYIANLVILKDIFTGLPQTRSIENGKIDRITESIIENAVNTSYVLKGTAAESLDEYLYTHSLNVGMLAMLIGKWLRYGEEKLASLVKAGILHDIGKCCVDFSILNKKGPLLPQEYQKVQKHVNNGYDIVKKIPFITNDVCMGVVMHHERMDGSGYPLALQKEQIHEFAKIIAVADVYDAMTSNRAYRLKQSPFDVFEYMGSVSMAGLDPKITLTFLENVASYYIGDTFILNSGDLCKVVFINPRQISRPLVQIGERYVDLSREKELKISAIV